MKTFFLQLLLKSDAAFGRGDGLAGVVDSEVQHDELGCPYLNGKEIKGNLVQECAGILSGLPNEKKTRWQASARRLFGQPGSTHADAPWLIIGDARLPQDLLARLAWEREQMLQQMRAAEPDQFEARRQGYENEYRAQILDTLTTIRQQTAMDETTGTAKDHSLRTTRVIIRETPFIARLEYRPVGTDSLDELTRCETDDLALLSACVAAFRRAGAGRNRGRGRLEAQLQDMDHQTVQAQYLCAFAQEVRK